jgi:hypothetical protein
VLAIYPIVNIEYFPDAQPGRCAAAMIGFKRTAPPRVKIKHRGGKRRAKLSG